MRTPHLAAVLIAALAAAPASADDPIVLADFEGPDYGDWTAAGDAFGTGPARGALPGQMSVSGYLGDGLVNSFLGGDRGTGTLTSPGFTINRDLIWFLVGGGGFEGETCIQLLVDGEVVRSAAGPNTEPGGSELLTPRSWDVRDLKGKSARIRIVDDATGGWGHINVDHIVLCDEPPTLPDEREDLLARAERSVAEAAARLGDDPTRPSVHFRPPAQWMNDPNGTIYHNGYYHLFYQHNPYGDAWGHMHWGHARSKDLVRWEHLPIALWPSRREGEEHVFSGCAAVNGKGELMLFYTSVGPGRPNEQWAAVATDPDGLSWRKLPENPILTTRMPDGTTFGRGMRDPYIFRHEGRTFMVVGADTETEAVIPIFEAADPSLAEWTYRGILWRAPKDEMKFPECPNFFPLDGKFVLLLSPFRAVEYRVGTFDLDTYTFTPEVEGRLDHSEQFYATNTATAPDGRTILFGWARGFPAGLGWNGCLALPRELTLGRGGHPRQQPAIDVRSLSGPQRDHQTPTLGIFDGMPIRALSGDRMMIFAGFETNRPRGPGRDVPVPDRYGLRFLDADGEPIAEVVREGEVLDVAGVPIPFGPIRPEELFLWVFVDRSLLEVFIDDGRHVVTRVVPHPGGPITPVAFTEGADILLTDFSTWELAPIWPTAPAE